MRWYKHFTDAHRDTKMKKLIREFGAEGYAVYFYCLELIAGDLDGDNVTFELEDDAELVAEFLRIDTLRVEKIMKNAVELELFGLASSGKITCLKLAKFLDADYTRNLELKKMIQGDRYKQTVSRLSADNRRQPPPAEQSREENSREEQTREEKESEAETASSSPVPKKPEKKHYGEFQKVTLTDDEFQKLGVNLGEAIRTAAITKLDTYMAAKGKTYKSCYAAIGSWVIDDLEKRGVIKAPADSKKWWEDGNDGK